MERTQNPYADGRLKLAVINKDNVLDCIVGKIKITGLPEDCKMYEVYYNNRTRCFELLVSSIEFEPVEEGAEIERINGVCKLRDV